MSFSRIKMVLLAAIIVIAAIAIAPPQAVTLAQETRPEPQAPQAEFTPTSQWAVQIADGFDVDTIAAQVGAENLGRIGSTSMFLFDFPGSATQPQLATRPLGSVAGVGMFNQVTIQPVTPLSVGDEPDFPIQWHLQNTGQGAAVSGNDANVVPAWNLGFDGTGVEIGIVEDNFQTTHPDLSPNYNAATSIFGPVTDHEHATSAAGVAAATEDGTVCGVGAAYNSSLATATWREGGGSITDAAIANSWTQHYGTTDIYSNSWGYTGPAQPLSGTLETALADGVTNGRGGLGAIYVIAAGNERTEGLWNDGTTYNNRDSNDSGVAASRYTITVAASSADGDYSGYSSLGAHMLVNAPSNGSGSGGSYIAIPTTDVQGSGGYDPGDCNDLSTGFGGTSSATPLVSGIIALMLDANPNLTWRDVQHILVETAETNDPTHPSWFTNAAGHDASIDYGHGRIDAEAAVTAAQTWTNVGPEETYTSSVVNVGQSIPDGGSKGTPGAPVTSTINVPEDLTIEHVEVVFNGTHTYRGDVQVDLTSPSGTTSQMLNFRADWDGGDNFVNWRLDSTHYWGESSQGTWEISVTDRWSGTTGTFDNWQLIIYGTGPTCYDLTTTQTGLGTVYIEPAPNCGPDQYLEGTEITLTADPDESYGFDGWSGDITSSDNPLVGPINSDLNIAAAFSPTSEILRNPSFELDVEGDFVPTHWPILATGPLNGERRACNKFAKDGSCLMLFNGDDMGIYGVEQTLTPSLHGLGNAGDEVTLTFWVRGVDVPTSTEFLGARIFMKNSGTQERTVKFCPVSDRGDLGWLQISCTASVSHDYDKFRVAFGFKNMTAGKVAFDLASLTDTTP